MFEISKFPRSQDSGDFHDLQKSLRLRVLRTPLSVSAGSAASNTGTGHNPATMAFENLCNFQSRGSLRFVGLEYQLSMANKSAKKEKY